MSPVARVFLGALLGGLVTLAVHPASRPFITGVANRTPLTDVLVAVDSQRGELRPPSDLLEASLWEQVGMEKLQAHRGLDSRELASLVKVADAGIERDGRNAYWYQVKAVLLLWSGERAKAESAWSAGARTDFWKDYQSERLMRTQQQLAERLRASQGWQYAAAYFSRSTAAAILIEGAARVFLSSKDYTSLAGATMRYNCLANGDLLRNGGRSLAISSHGANIVELSAYPADMASSVSPKRLWIGQTQMITGLQKLGLADDTARARQVFRANEGWMALALQEDYQRNAGNLALISILSSEGPMACMWAAVAGAMIWGLGRLLQRRFDTTSNIPRAWVIVAIAALGLAVALMSQSWLATLAVVLASAFLYFAPSQVRQSPSPDFGPLFVFVMLVIATGAGLAIAANAMSRTGPTAALSPAVGIPEQFTERPSLAAAALVIFSVAGIAVPMWGMFCRVGTAYVYAGAMRTIGVIMAVGSLMTAELMTPLCVYADHRASDVLSQLVQNEPVYYLVQ